MGMQPGHLNHRVNVLGQQGITQAQKAIDRIGGWTTGAFIKPKRTITSTLCHKFGNR
jgi:hypothetical protein